MEIRLLGAVELRIDGEAVPLAGPKQRGLLAMLALRINAPVPADRLNEGLWGESGPASAPKMVQLYVSQLRKLGLDIVTRGRAYELRLPADAVDAVRFEALVRAADRGEPTAAEALALWRGTPLDDVSGEPFAAAEIRRLEDLWLQARELANDEALAAGEHASLVADLDALVTAHPLRERLHGQRMLALYRSGRQADALEAYRAARATLIDAVGVEPGPDLQRLHAQILDQDPALAAPPSAGARRAAATAPAHDRRLLVAAAVVLVAGVAVFAATRLLGGGSLDRIAGDSVGLIDPGNGDITAQYAVGHGPGPIAAGAGSVWIANREDGTVSRIDRDDDRITTVDVGGEPTAVAFGAGSLWVTDALRRRLLQVNPASNRVTRRIRVGNGPRGVAVGAGAVWVASPIDDRVDRIDLAGGPTRRLTVTGGPESVAVGEGAVWVAAQDLGVVAKLEPRTGAPLGRVAVGGGPAAVAVGEGAVWVANRSDGTVSRIDPARDAVTDTVRTGGRPQALAVGAGRVWVGLGGTVAAVDPARRRVTRRIGVRGSPSGLLVAEGRVWTPALAPTASHRGGTLRYRSGPPAFCACLDPAGNDSRIIALVRPVYDGLVAYRHVGGSAGSTLTPDLATALPEPSADGRTYVFQLRPGLRFSDGRPVRPADVRASLERAVRLVGPPAPPYYGALRGADRCTPKRCDLSAGVRTDAGARTVTLRLSRPDPDLLQKLALPYAGVVPAGTPARLGTPPLGTGPYRVASFDAKRGARLVRNPRFASWSPEARPAGFPDVIDVSFSDDASAAVKAVRAGAADVTPLSDAAGTALPVADLRALTLADAPHIRAAALPATDYFFLNVREPPFDLPRVRRAFNLALDRRRLVTLFGGTGLASATCQIVPPGLPGYAPFCPFRHDPARARALVGDAAGARVDLWTFGGPYAPMAAYGARVLRGLGFRARVRTETDIGRYFATVGDSRRHVQIGVTGWTADVLTPSSFFEPNFTCRLRAPGSPDNLNLSQFCAPKVDAAFDAALAGGRGWPAVDRAVVAAGAAAPAVNRRVAVLVSDRVGNVQQHLEFGPLLDQMWVR